MKTTDYVNKNKAFLNEILAQLMRVSILSWKDIIAWKLLSFCYEIYLICFHPIFWLLDELRRALSETLPSSQLDFSHSHFSINKYPCLSYALK